MIDDNINNFCKNFQKGKKIMALDVGKVRIGIATSDPSHIISSPLTIYVRRNISRDLGYINDLAKNENVGYFVIGLPISLNGLEGENCQYIRQFAAKLYKKTTLPIFLQDERFSTSAVSRAMQDHDISRKKRHATDDKIAAAYILQMVLDRI